jgi:hypothetical protein
VPSPTPVPPPTINAPAELLPAWTLLVNLPKNGPFFRDNVPKTNVTITVGPQSAWGSFNTGTNVIVIKDAVVAGESTRAVAAVLSHELTHAIQLYQDPAWTGGCYQYEVGAYMREAEVWKESGGYLKESATFLTYFINGVTSVALTEGEGGILKRLHSDPAYQTQCR